MEALKKSKFGKNTLFLIFFQNIFQKPLEKIKKEYYIMEHETIVVLILCNGSRRGGMADALGSGPSSFTGVGVQLPPTAPNILLKLAGMA